MHWWPRHTPSTGVPDSPKARIASFERPASAGPARTGRDQHRVGLEGAHLVERDRVVAVDDRLGAQLTQVLDEVVDERVVVVDHQHARHGGIVAYSFAPCPRVRASGRATRRRRRRRRPLKLWVPVGLTTLLAVGLVVVVTNYLNLLPGPDTENRYLSSGSS